MGTKRRNPLGGLPSYLPLVLLLLLWLYQTFRSTPPPPAGPGQVQVFFMPEEGERAKAFLIARIEETHERLEVAAYEFRDLSIAKALLKAKDRGVRVRLYAESDYQEDVHRYLVAARLGQTQEPPKVKRGEIEVHIRATGPFCEEAAGLPVCYDAREPFMHHKFLVFDGKAVWTGSTNLTWNAFARNNENSLYLPSPALAEGYGREFEALWGGKKEGLGLPVRFSLEGVEGTAYFSPAGGRAAREAILARLRAAGKEVLVAAFVLTDPEILKALIQAKERGVRVRVVLESRNLTSSKVASQSEHLEEGLLRAGIDVRKDANPYTLHDKVMVIDETWVITGSYNFSNNAWRSNNENLLVLKSPELAQRYKKEVEALWEAGTPL